MREKLAACKTLASRGSPNFEVVVGQLVVVPAICAALECFMSTALRVGGVAALTLVPVAVVLTVWLLRQG